jgi:carboxypeptidase-like protein
MLIIRTLLTLFSLLVFNICLSQEISGVVLDSNNNKALEGASIYFDNTTIGTTTNSKGEFTLEISKDIKTPLIISFMGYETEILDNFPTTEKLDIYLKESVGILNEVVLASKDDWPREFKLKEFRKNYLGESINGLSSKILNEDDIVLKYNKKKKQLTARSKAPIIIKNNNLKYLITVDLQQFEVNYSYVSKNRKHVNVRYVYYSGSNFYKSLQAKPTNVTLRKRKEAYFGSTLHFMRALARGELEKEKYQIFLGNYPVTSKKYITVIPVDGIYNVKVRLKERLNIMFNGEKQSSIESLVPEFYIDNFGNHSPVEKVVFAGDLGSQRMGDALPLDFLLVKARN